MMTRAVGAWLCPSGNPVSRAKAERHVIGVLKDYPFWFIGRTIYLFYFLYFRGIEIENGRSSPDRL